MPMLVELMPMLSPLSDSEQLVLIIEACCIVVMPILCIILYKTRTQWMQETPDATPAGQQPEGGGGKSDSRACEAIRWTAELAAAKRLTEEQRMQLPAKERAAFDKSLYSRMIHWQQDDFEAEADKRLGGFLTALQQRYPALSATDRQLIVLFLLRVPQNDILLLMNYSPVSLPTIKQRLCRKLEIGSANLLVEQLDELLTTL